MGGKPIVPRSERRSLQRELVGLTETEARPGSPLVRVVHDVNSTSRTTPPVSIGRISYQVKLNPDAGKKPSGDFLVVTRNATKPSLLSYPSALKVGNGFGPAERVKDDLSRFGCVIILRRRE